MTAAKKLKTKSIPASPFDILIPQHADFVREYSIDFNATQAAIRARYSKKTAAQQASRLLRNVKIKEALAWLIARKTTPDSLTAQEARTRILDETREAYRRAVKAENLTAMSSLLQLMSRQHGMLTDKLITDDSKTEEIKDTERAEYRAIAQARLADTFKLRTGKADEPAPPGDEAPEAAKPPKPERPQIVQPISNEAIQ